MTDTASAPERGVTWSKEHVERIRKKATEADGLGTFWRGVMLAALDQIDIARKHGDIFGLALMMIREGAANPAQFAGEQLAKAKERAP